MEGTVSRRFSWPLRCALVTVGGLVLSLSITTLRAEPSSDKNGADVENKPQNAVAPDEPNTLEQRLQRIETMILGLTEQLQAEGRQKSERSAISTAPQAIATSTAPQAVPAPPAPETTSSAEKETSKSVRDVDVESSLADFKRTAKLNLELSETNYNRRLAAERQFEAVKTAFEAETISLDQVLEAQLRLAETRVSYARVASDLATDPAMREYVFALACLSASNQALNDARKIWKQIHAVYVVGSGGKEAHEEAQAREQYFQFKSQTQQQLDSYLKAKDAWAARKTGQNPQESKSKD